MRPKMAETKSRYINTFFWDDAYIETLCSDGKLLFLYLISTPHTNIAGSYEITPRKIFNHTDLPVEKILELLSKFETDGKIIYRDNWMFVLNAVSHQKLNPNILKGIATLLLSGPKWVLEAAFSHFSDEILASLCEIDGYFLKAFQSLSKPSQDLVKASNYLNLNLNLNSNPNSNLSTSVDDDLPSESVEEKEPRQERIEWAIPEVLRKEICKRRGKKGDAKVMTRDEAVLVQAVFHEWKTAFGKNGSARLTPERGRAVLDRIREPGEYSVEDITKAIYGCKWSPYHSGRDGRSGGQVYDDLELICRDDTHLENFLDLASKYQPKTTADPVEHEPEPIRNAKPPRPSALPDELSRRFWDLLRERVAARLSGDIERTWFEPLRFDGFDMANFSIRLRAHSIVKEWIERYYTGFIQDVAIEVTGHDELVIVWEVEAEEYE